jgi:hypothetical protein
MQHYWPLYGAQLGDMGMSHRSGSKIHAPSDRASLLLGRWCLDGKHPQ